MAVAAAGCVTPPGPEGAPPESQVTAPEAAGDTAVQPGPESGLGDEAGAPEGEAGALMKRGHEAFAAEDFAAAAEAFGQAAKIAP